MNKLNLGAGNAIVADAINHDLVKHRPEIAVAHDLNVRPWPWPDRSMDLIMAKSVFEHLRITLVEAVDECWRILRPDGQLYMKLPVWNHEHAYEDPTHYWRFTLRSFDLFDPATTNGQVYGYYTPRKWKIIMPAMLNKSQSSIHVTLQKVA